MLRTRIAGLSCCLALTLTMGASAVRADANDRERRGREHDAITGADWWQWALSIPTADNPLLEDNRQDCMIGQRGDVWFLAGLFNGGAIERWCQIPEGVDLFFPVVNSVNFDAPGVCGQTEPYAVRDLRDASKAFIDGIDHYRVTLDRRPVRSIRRLQSKVFTVALPASNVFDAPCESLSDVPRGIYSPAVDDGLYALVTDLRPGRHTLRIEAADAAGKFGIAITYHLRVVGR